jgi:alpha-glucosidase (family GH31 glycosyl hydrolase)
MIRSSIILRYKLLPYFYSVFYQYYKVGTPMLRPVWFNNINSDYLYTAAANNQLYLGDGILVRPVLNLQEHERQE